MILLSLILFIAYLFEPIDGFAFEPFLDGDMSHGCGGCCAVPVFLPWWEPDHVPGANLLDGAIPTLCEAAASGDDERLTERVRVPSRPRTGLKCNTGAQDAGWVWCVEQGINPYIACKILSGAFA